MQAALHSCQRPTNNFRSCSPTRRWARAQPGHHGNPAHRFRGARCRVARRRLAASWPHRNPHAATRRRRALSTATRARGPVPGNARTLVHLGVAAARTLRSGTRGAWGGAQSHARRAYAACRCGRTSRRCVRVRVRWRWSGCRASVRAPSAGCSSRPSRGVRSVCCIAASVSRARLRLAMLRLLLEPQVSLCGRARLKSHQEPGRHSRAHRSRVGRRRGVRRVSTMHPAPIDSLFEPGVGGGAVRFTGAAGAASAHGTGISAGRARARATRVWVAAHVPELPLLALHSVHAARAARGDRCRRRNHALSPPMRGPQAAGVRIGMTLARRSPPRRHRSRPRDRRAASADAAPGRHRRRVHAAGVDRPPRRAAARDQAEHPLFGGLRELCRRLARGRFAFAACAHALRPSRRISRSRRRRWPGSSRRARERAASSPIPGVLPARLKPLPLAVLRWPEEHFARLYRDGRAHAGRAPAPAARGVRPSVSAPSSSPTLDHLLWPTRRSAPRRSRARERYSGPASISITKWRSANRLQALAPLLAELEFLRARQRGITALQFTSITIAPRPPPACSGSPRPRRAPNGCARCCVNGLPRSRCRNPCAAANCAPARSMQGRFESVVVVSR